MEKKVAHTKPAPPISPEQVMSLTSFETGLTTITRELYLQIILSANKIKVAELSVKDATQELQLAKQAILKAEEAVNTHQNHGLLHSNKVASERLKHNADLYKQVSNKIAELSSETSKQNKLIISKKIIALQMCLTYLSDPSKHSLDLVRAMQGLRSWNDRRGLFSFIPSETESLVVKTIAHLRKWEQKNDLIASNKRINRP